MGQIVLKEVYVLFATSLSHLLLSHVNDVSFGLVVCGIADQLCENVLVDELLHDTLSSLQLHFVVLLITPVLLGVVATIALLSRVGHDQAL